MSERIVYKRLKEAWPHVIQDNKARALGQFLAGLLLDVHEKDLALFNHLCTTLKDDLELFVKELNFKGDAQLASHSFTHLCHIFCSAEAGIIIPRDVPEVDAPADDAKFMWASVRPSNQAFFDFSSHFKEILDPIFAYDLPERCDMTNHRKVSKFNAYYSHKDFATKEKVMAALLRGFTITPDSSQYLLSPSAIKQFNLNNNIVVNLVHRKEKAHNWCTPTLRPLKSITISPYITPDLKSNKISSLVGMLTSLVAPIDIIQQIALKDFPFNEFVDEQLSELSASIASAASIPVMLFGEAQYLLLDRKKEHLHLQAQALSSTSYDRDKRHGIAEKYVQKVISYYCGAIHVLEAYIESANTNAAQLLQSSDDSNVQLKFYAFAKTLSDTLESFKLPDIFIKDAIRSIEESKTNHISQLLHQILSTSPVKGDLLNLPRSLLVKHLPNHCLVDVLSRGLDADNTLRLITDVYIKRDPEKCNLIAEANDAIDVLLAVERKHPGLIFSFDSITPESGHGIKEFNFHFDGSFAEQYFACFGKRNDLVGSWFSQELASRFTREITLANASRRDIPEGNADMSFMNQHKL